jgi:hypothetical protein
MRTVAQGREGFPGGVRQCSGKRRARSIRPFRGTRKGREIEGDDGDGRDLRPQEYRPSGISDERAAITGEVSVSFSDEERAELIATLTNAVLVADRLPNDAER